jgi:hypothetical protein
LTDYSSEIEWGFIGFLKRITPDWKLMKNQFRSPSNGILDSICTYLLIATSNLNKESTSTRKHFLPFCLSLPI